MGLRIWKLGWWSKGGKFETESRKEENGKKWTQRINKLNELKESNLQSFFMGPISCKFMGQIKQKLVNLWVKFGRTH
jgi:hypothetical protein